MNGAYSPGEKQPRELKLTPSRRCRMGDWILHLALRENAILVMPDHRLMPEAKGLDILADVHDFVAWLLDPSNLQPHLPDGVTPDPDNILVTGESAGGWLALQTALHVPTRVKAVIAHYPMIDLRDKHYTADYEKQIFVPPIPQLDRSILRDFLANLKGDEVVTSAIPPARSEIFASMLQQGSLGKFFGDDTSLYPIEVLDKVDQVPPTWILHGVQDSVIPIAGTSAYAETLKKEHPEAKLHLSYREGDHGFDNEPPAKLEDEWVQEGCEFIARYWAER